MIEAALAYLHRQALQAEGRLVTVGERTFSTTPLHDTRVKDPEPPVVEVRTLGAVVDYLSENQDGLSAKEVFLHIVSPRRVEVVSHIFGEMNQRSTYLVALSPIPSLVTGIYEPVEEAVIQLMQHFTATPGREELLKLLGNVQTEAVTTRKDDGVTQKVQARAEVVGVETVEVPNPVALAPYRTFREVNQPASPFLFRLKMAQDQVLAMLDEADGKEWELLAVERVRAWLAEQLSGWPILG